MACLTKWCKKHHLDLPSEKILCPEHAELERNKQLVSRVLSPPPPNLGKSRKREQPQNKRETLRQVQNQRAHPDLSQAVVVVVVVVPVAAVVVVAQENPKKTQLQQQTQTQLQQQTQFLINASG
jgi:hypothetical protein